MALFNYISNLLDDPDPVIITPYGGYANEQTVHALARVLEDEGIQHTEEDSIAKTLWNSYKRFETDEKPGAKVRVSIGDQTHDLYSDYEGYVALSTQHRLQLNPRQATWFTVRYQLIQENEPTFSVITSVQKPSTEAAFAVISDLDDTVLHTGVSSPLKWRLLVNSVIKQSHQRLPLEGMQEFYKLLHMGGSSATKNPFFYLSNSPWNLYDYLASFLREFGFPRGTILLRDFSLGQLSNQSIFEGNKYKKMVHLLETFPSLPFILVGDAAEADTDIYLHIARKFPNRILTIYIRSINRSKKVKRIKRLIEENTDIEIVLISDGLEAVEHARAKGLIKTQNLNSGI